MSAIGAGGDDVVVVDSSRGAVGGRWQRHTCSNPAICGWIFLSRGAVGAPGRSPEQAGG